MGPEEALIEELWGLLEEEVGRGGGGVVERVATRFEAVQRGRVGVYSRGIGGVGGKWRRAQGNQCPMHGAGPRWDALVQEQTFEPFISVQEDTVICTLMNLVAGRRSRALRGMGTEEAFKDIWGIAFD